MEQAQQGSGAGSRGSVDAGGIIFSMSARKNETPEARKGTFAPFDPRVEIASRPVLGESGISLGPPKLLRNFECCAARSPAMYRSARTRIKLLWARLQIVICARYSLLKDLCLS
jgi:hypothetical protein